eukprot:jgi/Tetstr1/464381/TSEL_009174.t1
MIFKGEEEVCEVTPHREAAEKEARAHGSLDADPRRMSSQFTAASTQHTTRGASAFRPPRMAAIEEECDAHMAAAIRTYKLGGEAAEEGDFCGSDSSEESEEGGAGEGLQQLIPPTPPGAVRVACCAPTCRNSIYGRMSLFTGVQATHGGSQHQCAFCEGHFHAFCGATDTETPGAPEWCGCNGGFQELEAGDQQQRISNSAQHQGQSADKGNVGTGQAVATGNNAIKKRKSAGAARQAKHRAKKRQEKIESIAGAQRGRGRGRGGRGRGHGGGRGDSEADDDLQAPDSREGHYEEPDFVVAADCDDDDDDADGGGNGDTAKYWSPGETARLVHCVAHEKIRALFQQMLSEPFVKLKARLSSCTKNFTSSGRAGQSDEALKSEFCRQKNGQVNVGLLYAWCFSSHESVGISQALLRQVPEGAARAPFQSGDSAPYKDPPVPAGHRSVTRVNMDTHASQPAGQHQDSHSSDLLHDLVGVLAHQHKRAGGIIKHTTTAVKNNLAATQSVPGDNIDEGGSPETPAKKAKQPAKPAAGVPARGRGVPVAGRPPGRRSRCRHPRAAGWPLRRSRPKPDVNN